MWRLMRRRQQLSKWSESWWCNTGGEMQWTTTTSQQCTYKKVQGLFTLNYICNFYCTNLPKQLCPKPEQIGFTYREPGYIMEHCVVQKTLSDCTWRALPLGSCRVLCGGCSWHALSGNWTRSQESPRPCPSWQTLTEHCISMVERER